MTNEQTTGDDGKATFQLEYGDYVATITKDGYVTKTENIAFRSNHKNFSITLVEDTPTGTGTVTVTCQDESENPVENAIVYLYTGDTPPSQEDDSMITAVTRTGVDGTGTLGLWDKETHQPTEETQIPFGTYNLLSKKASKEYTGTLTVDGDEEITITLTSE